MCLKFVHSYIRNYPHGQLEEFSFFAALFWQALPY